MNYQKIIIYDHTDLFKILNELKNELNFEILEFSKKDLFKLLSKNSENSLVITKKKIKEINDQIIISDFPIRILKLLEKNKDIKSKHHLLGYILNYQGYYGFGDSQLERIINKLAIFYDEEQDALTLNRKGYEALLGLHNFSNEINDDLVFGGVRKLDFQFNRKENKLIKTVPNAN